jgi:hypothetical protein
MGAFSMRKNSPNVYFRWMLTAMWNISLSCINELYAQFWMKRNAVLATAHISMWVIVRNVQICTKSALWMSCKGFHILLSSVSKYYLSESLPRKLSVTCHLHCYSEQALTDTRVAGKVVYLSADEVHTKNCGCKPPTFLNGILIHGREIGKVQS